MAEFQKDIVPQGEDEKTLAKDRKEFSENRLSDVRKNQSDEIDEGERAEFLAAMQAMDKDSDVGEANRGELIAGTIMSLGDDFAFIDLGGKSEGMLSIEELKGPDGTLPKVGDKVEACVLSSGPNGVVLSKRLAKGIRSREFLKEAAQNHIPVEGRITGRNKGGFDVEVAGVRGFCPIGQIELRFCEDPDVHLGKKYTFLINKYDNSGRTPDMVVSRREFLEIEAKAKADELRKTLKEGDIISGTVRSVRDFGAFVDLGGLEGLLPVSEISYSRVDNPRDVLRDGEEIHVQVISMDQGADRITLSLKRLEADPWQDAGMSFPIGTRVKGKVIRIQNFGAFVELTPGLDGLIHISNFNTPERVSDIKKVVQEGQEIEVEVITFDPVKKRIGLARVPSQGEFGAIPIVGEIREGTVDSVVNFGVFVTLGPGRKGLVPNAEMGTAKGTDHRKQFPPGTSIKVKILEVTDGGKKIRLSRLAAIEESERAEYEDFLQKDHTDSQERFGTFGDLFNKK